MAKSDMDELTELLKHDSFGQDLKRIMEYKGIKPKELSDLTGTNLSTIYYLFSRRNLPTLKTLFRIAKVLNVSPEFLLSLVQPSDLRN